MNDLIERLRAALADRYDLERELGGGGMAQVYLGRDRKHERPVALKVLRPEYAASFAAERFLREIEIAARLQHPHVVPLLDSGEVGGLLYLVMPFIEGETLRARLARERRLSATDAIRILVDVADALAYAHDKGIVHRDIKPDNILLAGRHALVTDFGVAKAVSAATLAPRELTIGVALGTPTYMAPEQATADPDLDHRVDIYALGIVGYELLAGEPPFSGPTVQSILTAHVLDAPAPLTDYRTDLSPALVDVIEKSLAKKADDRWQTAQEVLAQLEPLATPSGGVTPTQVAPVRRPTHWGVWAGMAAVGVGLMVGLFNLLGRRTGALDLPVTQHQLTFSGHVHSSAISPDGQLLASIVQRDLDDEIQIQDLRASTTLSVASGSGLRSLNWSGDGTELRYGALNGDHYSVFSVPRLGGVPRPLLEVGLATLDPAGRRMALGTSGGSGGVVVDLQRGDSIRYHLSGYRWYGDPVWSPNGEWLTFNGVNAEERRYGLLIVRPGDDASLRVLLTDSMPLGAPTWSPDGDQLFFLREAGQEGEIRAIAASQERGEVRGKARVLASGFGGEALFEATISVADHGRKVFYTRGNLWSNLALARAGGHPKPVPEPLTMGSAFFVSARFSPDGKRIAVVRQQTTDESLVIHDLSAPRDGRELARGIRIGWPAWSADGSRIAVLFGDSSSRAKLRLYSVDGGGSVAISDDSVGWSPGWLGDSLIAIQHTANRGLQLIGIRDHSKRTFPGVDTMGWAFRPILSPDGRHLAFAWNRGRGKLGLYLSDFTNPPRMLYDGPVMPFAWSADGRTLYAGTVTGSASKSDAFAFSMDGRPPRVLGSFDRSNQIEDIHPDGPTVLLNIPDGRTDTWVVEVPDSRR